MCYQFECHQDGEFEVIMHHTEHKNPWPCPVCGQPSYQLFSANVFMQPDPYWSGTYIPGLDRVVNSKAGLEQAMIETNSRRWEAGMDKDCERVKQYQEEANDRERQKILQDTLKDF